MSDPDKRAPVQDRSGIVKSIPWEMHLRAYAAYAKKWAPQQAMIEGGCRGGFSTGELDGFIPGWREELPELETLAAEVKRLRTALTASQAALEVAEAELAKARRVIAPFAEAWRTFPNHPQLRETNAYDAGMASTLIFAEYEAAAQFIARHASAPDPNPGET